MKKFLASCWFLLLVGCGGGGSGAPESTSVSLGTQPAPEQVKPSSGRKSVSQTINGVVVDRTYTIRYPEALSNDDYPVFIFFHDAGEESDNWLSENPEISRMIDAGHFIGVFPDGHEQQWNVSDSSGADDVEFVSVIVSSFDQMLIDRDRIYATGIGNGAQLVTKLAKETSLLAGIAPLFGNQTVAQRDYVAPQALSVFQVSGFEAAVAEASSADEVLSAKESAENWASSFNCTLTPDEGTRVWATEPVAEFTFTRCLMNKKVRYAVLETTETAADFKNDFNLFSTVWVFFDSADRLESRSVKFLALGDSYTVGQSVCSLCNFPEQLKGQLKAEFAASDDVALEMVAKTGWTTTNLISALDAQVLADDFDFVTLLIGVNNQFQNKPFELYEREFVELVNSAVAFVRGDKTRVLVVSIPDYAYTTFGQSRNPDLISAEIAVYNSFAENYCAENGVSFTYITDITQRGIVEPELVATDGLHPSSVAYREFVERLLPVTLGALY